SENYQTNSRSHAQYIEALNVAYERAKRGPASDATSAATTIASSARRRGWRRIFSSNEDSSGEGRYEPNHYELLHVQSHADREIIDLAATFLRHSSAAQSGFTATREQISAAYHTLVDPELRAEYDRKLGLVCAGTPATGYHTTGSQEAPADRTVHHLRRPRHDNRRDPEPGTEGTGESGSIGLMGRTGALGASGAASDGSSANRAPGRLHVHRPNTSERNRCIHRCRAVSTSLDDRGCRRSDRPRP